MLDPVNLLQRGWSITRTADGGVVRSIAQLAAGDEIVTRLADGAITSAVTSTVSTPPNDEDPLR